jgi:hypothetical protein
MAALCLPSCRHFREGFCPWWNHSQQLLYLYGSMWNWGKQARSRCLVDDPVGLPRPLYVEALLGTGR